MLSSTLNGCVRETRSWIPCGVQFVPPLATADNQHKNSNPFLDCFVPRNDTKPRRGVGY